jgi:DNA-binding MarR family transcriptional regulator
MPRDISLTTAATLNLLEWAGPQRMTQLAAREGVAQPSMTALVGKLEAQGLAERRADPSDARAVLVALTAAGQRYVRDRRRTGAAMLAEVLGDLAEEEASSLCAALPALEAVVAAAERRVLSGGQLATTGRGTHR